MNPSERNSVSRRESLYIEGAAKKPTSPYTVLTATHPRNSSYSCNISDKYVNEDLFLNSSINMFIDIFK